MAKKTHNELVAGVFIIAALAVTLGVVIWLGAADMLLTRGQTVSFYVPQSAGSTGLTEGAEVLYGDAPVGQIIEIVVDPVKRRCLYRARLTRKDIFVKSDGSAIVSSPPIGTARVVIKNCGKADTLADDDRPLLLTGGIDKAMADISAAAASIQRELDTTRDEALLKKAHVIIDHLTLAAANVAKIAAAVQTETNREATGSLLAKAHKSADDVNKMTGDARPKMERTMTAVAETAEKVRTYVDKDVADLLARLREVNTEILKTAKNLSEVSDATKKIIVLNKDNIDEIIDNMTLVSANLKATSKEVRRHPWKLLHKPKPGEVHSQNVYDAARAFSDGAGRLNQAARKLAALSKAHPEGLPKDDPELAKIQDDLKKTFSRFKKIEDYLWKEVEK